jgi:hypothetical protein
MCLRVRNQEECLTLREEQEYEDDYFRNFHVLHILIVIKSRETNMLEIRNVYRTSSDKIIRGG